MRSPRGKGSCRHNTSRQAKKAAKVFPEPVGASKSVFLPVAMAGQPSRCTGVGSPMARRNHSRTGGRNRARGSALGILRTFARADGHAILVYSVGWGTQVLGQMQLSANAAKHS